MFRMENVYLSKKVLLMTFTGGVSLYQKVFLMELTYYVLVSAGVKICPIVLNAGDRCVTQASQNVTLAQAAV